MLKTKIFFLLAIGLVFPILSGARTYDFYVDASNTGSEDGTSVHPYNTIAEAVTAAASNDEDSREIYIYAGEYREMIELTEKVELYGEDDDDVVIIARATDKNDYDYGVKMKKDTKIKDLTVKYGEYGVLIDDDGQAEIDHCNIEDAKDVGIKVEGAKNTDKDYLVTINNTKVKDSRAKGMEIDERRVDIRDCEIYENEEEGIDFRDKAKGKVKDNKIYDNEESGIELEMKDVDLEFEDNEIEDNDASAFAIQYREKYDKYLQDNSLIFEGNEGIDNDSYGIRCSRPMGGEPVYGFFREAVTLVDNDFSGNGLGEFSTLCDFL